jgi:hypothetical protein
MEYEVAQDGINDLDPNSEDEDLLDDVKDASRPNNNP